jgi:hypothetical protein
MICLASYRVHRMYCIFFFLQAMSGCRLSWVGEKAAEASHLWYQQRNENSLGKIRYCFRYTERWHYLLFYVLVGGGGGGGGVEV